MNFDPLFEDLEAMFSASEADQRAYFSVESFAAATSIELVLQSGQRQIIVAPLLGQGFAAGVNPDAPNWVVVPLGALRSLSFGFDSTFGLPTLKFSDLYLQEHLQQIPMPSLCHYLTQNPDDSLATSTLLGVRQGLLFMQLMGTHTVRAVPLAQVAQLRVWAVDNLGKDS